ncbi:phosphocholine cytidylyltransferase family protein [Candidatus Marinimicrobia bacterium]|nr:phosphocholine cytidylyltransferase family protein [Candidatus Neomarinimicrobiota bacterium]
MKAIILAAGMGTRLHPITINHPKCLLELNGKSILSHQIKLLNSFNIDKIEIITGYMSQKIESHIKKKASYFYYKDFNKTNNLYTLSNHLDLLDGELLILFSDVLISPLILKNLVESKYDFSLLVDTDKCDESTMRVLIKKNKIKDIGSHILPAEGHGNFIGIAKFSKFGSSLLKNKIKCLTSSNNYINDYYTKAIAELVNDGKGINYISTLGLSWMEIDTYDEYQKAKEEKFYVL